MLRGCLEVDYIHLHFSYKFISILLYVLCDMTAKYGKIVSATLYAAIMLSAGSAW
jgi:hypothetical protein